MPAGPTYFSLHKALAQSVAATIAGMIGTAIIGIGGDSVRVRKVPWTNDFGSMDLTTGKLPTDKLHEWPAILVCYFDFEAFDPPAGPNDRDQIGYPITVVFAKPNAALDSETDDDVFLRWREAVERTFTKLRAFNGHLPVVANGKTYTFHNCMTKPGAIFEWNRFLTEGASLDYGWITFSFIIWREAAF